MSDSAQNLSTATPSRPSMLQKLKTSLVAGNGLNASAVIDPPTSSSTTAPDPGIVVPAAAPTDNPVASDPVTNSVTPVAVVPSDTTPVSDALDSIAAAVPTAVDQATDTLNPAYPGATGSAKELPPVTVTVERPGVDQVPGVQYVEHEKSMEIPPEVDSFIKKVESHHDQIPHEIVISDPSSLQSTPRVLAQPVIVLPITPEIEDVGQRKSPKYSVRWLVEWSRKIMKMFSGKVIYRQE